MFKFAPLLAYTFAMNISSKYLFAQHSLLLEELSRNEFSRLDSLHHISAGFKATFSRIAYDGIDSCRQACGGAGFSAHSGLPSLQGDYAPNTTYEGDNTVLLQQAARLISKTWKKLYIKESGERATGLFSYFNEVDALLKSKSEIKTVEDALCLNKLDRALAVRAAFKVKRAMDLVALKTQEGTTDNELVHSLLAVDLVSMAQAHMMYVVFQIFRSTVEKPDTFKCPKIRENMQDLARLFALTELLNGADSSAVYEAGHFAMGTASILLDASKKLMVKIRPQMISLVESWDFSDSVLVSAIGNSYGDIYE